MGNTSDRQRAFAIIDESFRRVRQATPSRTIESLLQTVEKFDRPFDIDGDAWRRVMSDYHRYAERLPSPKLSPAEERGAGMARATDPPSAKETASAVDVAALESLVLAALRKSPNGMTSHEISAATGVELVSISPRMKPLVRKGFVVDSGQVDRSSGHPRTIWVTITL